MLQWERGRVLSVSAPWRGVQTLEVEVEMSAQGQGEAQDGAVVATQDGAEVQAQTARAVPALSYPELVGGIEVGEEVLLNSNALQRGLGTGGQALVVARTEVLPDSAPPRGHMVKARYTPMQTVVDALDDPDSPHRGALERAEGLDSMPVVLADLHSALPAIVAGIRTMRPDARIAYVMTDGAALPAAYSRTVAVLREEGMLTSCITAGQAFGGDLEAVTVPSALLGARAVVGADVTIVAQGPGNLGTGTDWGFSGIQAAEALHAAHVLGGSPIAALRVSGADARSRHHGVSHHSLTLLGRAALGPATIPVPVWLASDAGDRDNDDDADNSEFIAYVHQQLRTAVTGPAAERGVHHRLVEVSAAGLLEELRRSPVRMSTMGRGLDADSSPFLFAAVAGRHAAEVSDAVREVSDGDREGSAGASAAGSSGV